MIIFQKTMLQWMTRLSKLTRQRKAVWYDTPGGYQAEAEGFVFRLETFYISDRQLTEGMGR